MCPVQLFTSILGELQPRSLGVQRRVGGPLAHPARGGKSRKLSSSPLPAPQLLFGRGVPQFQRRDPCRQRRLLVFQLADACLLVRERGLPMCQSGKGNLVLTAQSGDALGVGGQIALNGGLFGAEMVQLGACLREITVGGGAAGSLFVKCLTCRDDTLIEGAYRGPSRRAVDLGLLSPTNRARQGVRVPPQEAGQVLVLDRLTLLGLLCLPFESR